MLSGRSSREPETVAEAAGPWWAQIYCLRERAVTEEYVQRVAAGTKGIIVSHHGGRQLDRVAWRGAHRLCLQ